MASRPEFVKSLCGQPEGTGAVRGPRREKFRCLPQAANASLVIGGADGPAVPV